MAEKAVSKGLKVEGSGGYRWVMLALFALLNLLICFCQFQPSFFAQNIMADFGINQSGFAWVTSIPMLIGLVLSAVCGNLADRFGIRKTIMLALAISAIATLCRAYASTYVLLLITCSLLGIVASFLSATMAKMAMLWFPPRQIGLAIGVINATGSAGIAAAQALNGVLFPDYHSAFLGGGVAMIAALVLWVFFGRDRATISEIVENDDEEPKKKSGFKEVVKSKGVWEAGIAGAFYNGFNITAGSLLITALVVYWNVDPVQAGVVSSLFTLGMMVGSILLPTYIPRFKKAKLLCILMPLVSMACVFIGWNIDIMAVRCVLFAAGGIVFGGIMPTLVSFPSVLPEIDHNNSGSAGGLMMSIMMIGSVVFPSMVITPIAGSNYNLMMIMACVVAACGAVPFAMLPSIHRSAEKRDDSQK